MVEHTAAQCHRRAHLFRDLQGDVGPVGGDVDVHVRDDFGQFQHGGASIQKDGAALLDKPHRLLGDDVLLRFVGDVLYLNPFPFRLRFQILGSPADAQDEAFLCQKVQIPMQRHDTDVVKFLGQLFETDHLLLPDELL